MSESGLTLSCGVVVPLQEISVHAIRAQGAGGQNVNKVSSAVHIRFDIQASSLPESIKTRLLRLRDRRITKQGVVIIKAQQYRSQDKNREDGLNRLKALLLQAMQKPKNRIQTRPSRNARMRRLDQKTRRGRIKHLRRKVRDM